MQFYFISLRNLKKLWIAKVFLILPCKQDCYQMTDFPAFSKHTDMPSHRRNMKENPIKAGKKNNELSQDI